MDTLAWIIVVAFAIAAGGGAGFFLKRVANARAIREDEASAASARSDADRILNEARSEQKEILVDAKEEALRLRDSAEKDARERRNEVQQQERRILQREEHLDKKSENLERREQSVAERDEQLETLKAETNELRGRRTAELERVAGLSREEAKASLLSAVEEEARIDATRLLHQIEDETKEKAETKTREILISSLQRMTQDVVSETTVSTVSIPSDDMKGRIIGREGRNIRALEAATGCDLIIDDTPEAVTVSAFDPVRREIAKNALTRLIADGRMHPARIEEMIGKARQDIDQSIREEGERMIFESGVHGLHQELIRLLGRMKYRYSYGQNLMKHSLEVAHLSAMIAGELGLDVKLAKTAGLLHDIGKVSDYDVEGPHAIIGGDIVKKYHQPEEVVIGVAAHHYEIEPNIYGVLTATADAISGGRPGARRESLDLYIKRLESLERIANSFDGVEKSFAIQAGREVRVLVRPESIDDLESVRLAREVAKNIEDNLTYPGQIKVTVVRETRSVEYAR